MRHFLIYISISTIVLLPGCKKYLSEEPRVQTSIQTAEQLDALINNATQFCFDGGLLNTNPSEGYATDDTEIPLDAFKNYPTRWQIQELFHYTFKIDEVIANASDPYYSGIYRQIFTANLILENVSKVSGDETLKAAIKADAHFIRAYNYWLLANHYCLPYGFGKNESALGMSLKKKTDYNEEMKRSTLKETYDFILEDLLEAAKTSRNDVDPQRPWRVSKKAIAAFMSRFYLFQGKYAEALAQTEIALSTSTVNLLDWSTVVAGTPEAYSNPSVTITYSEFNDWNSTKFLYFKEFYMPRFSYQGGQWLIPGTALRSLYDQAKDYRFKWLMSPDGGRRISVITPSAWRYAFFQDGMFIPSGPTAGEMLLNKAEILARQGEITEALSMVNLLRAKRLDNPAELTAADQDDAIQKVLEERRREFPFAFRWYDIRRFSINDYPADDVNISRTFYKVSISGVDLNSTENYTLPVGSLRYAVPINGVEISASNNMIQQNQY